MKTDFSGKNYFKELFFCSLLNFLRNYSKSRRRSFRWLFLICAKSYNRTLCHPTSPAESYFKFGANAQAQKSVKWSAPQKLRASLLQIVSRDTQCLNCRGNTPLRRNSASLRRKNAYWLISTRKTFFLVSIKCLDKNGQCRHENSVLPFMRVNILFVRPETFSFQDASDYGYGSSPP